MPFGFFIYYHVPFISPVPSSLLLFVLTFFFFFFSSYSLLLAETQLSAWQITEVLKNQKCPGWPGTTVTHPHQGNVLLSLPIFLLPPCFFFPLPRFFCVVSLLYIPLVAISKACSFYSLFLLFLHSPPFFHPNLPSFPRSYRS